MELSHQFTVPTGVEETWAHFEDIAAVAECFPGAQVTSAEGDSFAGSVKVKLGPIALVYNGTGTFVEKDEAAQRFVVDAKGKDKRGNGTAGAHVTVAMVDDGGSTRGLGGHRPGDHRQAGPVRTRGDAGRLRQAARAVRRRASRQAGRAHRVPSPLSTYRAVRRRPSRIRRPSRSQRPPRSPRCGSPNRRPSTSAARCCRSSRRPTGSRWPERVAGIAVVWWLARR